jgi:hypothetical protein
MKFTAAALALLVGTSLGTAHADQGPVPHGIPALNHVFIIMMENHGYAQIIGNPYMPFTNAEAASANLANNYFGVAHPSLTNYLEVTGGSNFGILDDNSPIWSGSCVSTLTPAGATNESSSVNNCPVSGTGVDTATPLIDFSNETSGPPGIIEINGKKQYPAASTLGITIADQLVAANLTWKTYQESLPLSGPYGVTTSDGYFSDNSSYTAEETGLGETAGSIAKLYRVKHNPFAYFATVLATANVATGQIPGMSGYEGATGLWADLATGNVPSYSFIVPNQCHDQHAGTSSGFTYEFCNDDPDDNGTQAGLNPGLMAVGDQEIQSIVTAIKASPAWKTGRSAIVITWDEDDYSVAPVTNQIVTIIDKNYGQQGVQSTVGYTHFSLLKSIEAAFGLPCLNHACDASTTVMSDLFR